MSLIQSGPTTTRQVAANRANAQKSTGPRTPEGKARSRFNALKHGWRGNFFRKVLLDLHENPQEFRSLLEDMMESLHPTSPLEAHLAQELAKLLWKKSRLERAQLGLQVCAREEMEIAHLHAVRARERKVVETPREEQLEKGLLHSLHSVAEFNDATDLLLSVAGRVEEGEWAEAGVYELRRLYGQQPVGRGKLIIELYEGLTRVKTPDLSPVLQANRAALEKLLNRECCDLLRDQEIFEREHDQVSAARRQAALIPSDPRWIWLLRQEAMLERQIDRKVKLLTMLHTRAERKTVGQRSARRERQKSRKK